MAFAGEVIVRRNIEQCSNWGRWGPADQRGALNYVGPAEVAGAAALVRRGKVISLTLPYDQFGPQIGGVRSNPRNLMAATGTDYLAGAQDPLPADWGRPTGSAGPTTS